MIPPSSEVVRKTRSPQRTCEEWPRPGIAVFPVTFCVALHTAGNSVSGEIPWLSGPRHCAQFATLFTGLAFRGLVIAVGSDSAAPKALASNTVSMTRVLFILAQKFGWFFQFCFPRGQIPRFVRWYRKLKEGAL